MRCIFEEKQWYVKIKDYVGEKGAQICFHMGTRILL
jgi:hypothetical protein